MAETDTPKIQVRKEDGEIFEVDNFDAAIEQLEAPDTEKISFTHHEHSRLIIRSNGTWENWK